MKLLHLTLAGLSAISVNALPARSNAIRSGDADLIARQLSDTSNDLTDGSACQAITVIFARGTTETGNIGAVVGPALKSALGTGTAFQGVTYPADVAGFLQGGDSTGSATMASLVSQASTQCPDTKIVLSGYSQGGQLVHNAATSLSSDLAAKISSAVIFGDPDNGKAVGSIPSSKTKIFCATGDDICAGGDLILAPHLSYGSNASAAAQFIKAAAAA